MDISPFDYLRCNLELLSRLIECVKSHVQLDNSGNNSKENIDSIRGINNSETFDHVETSQAYAITEKPNSFYVSLFIHGHRLSNCIIDSGDSNNIMQL